MAMLWRWPPERYSTLVRGSGMRMPSSCEHLRRPRVHRLLVEEGHAENAALRLAAEHDVAADVDRVAEREVLVDHLDPLAAGVGGRGDASLAPSMRILPASGIDGAG